MRILIDLQGAQTESRYRGIGRYSLAFAEHLAKHPRGHEFYYALNSAFPESIEFIRRYLSPWVPNRRFILFKTPTPVASGDLNNEVRRRAAEVIREAFIESMQFDAVHICSIFEGSADDSVSSISVFDKGTPTTVTGYDLIPLIYPREYFDGDPNYAQHYQEKINYIRRADAVFAISQSSSKEFVEHINVASHKMFHTPLGVDSLFTNATNVEYDCESIARFNLPEHYVLYVGGTDHRKNIPRLIEAYAGLGIEMRRKHSLVVAGKISEAEQQRLIDVADAFSVAEFIYFTNFISDLELVSLYRLATVLVFPSWHEGFGLPVLEAIKCGTPVIAAATSSLPEVVGCADALFDPFSVESMRDKLKQVLSDEAFRQRIFEQSSAHVVVFTWEATANAAISAWEGMVSPRAIRSGCQEVADHYKNVIAPRLLCAVQEIAASLKEEQRDGLLALAAKSIAFNERQLQRTFFDQRFPWYVEGPVNDSYSLALVNREFSRALLNSGQAAFISSADGPGKIPLSDSFEMLHPDLFKATVDGVGNAGFDSFIHSRNMYPPRSEDMHGAFNFMHAYGWEESQFPSSWVSEINASVDGISTMSTHVQKILIDSGVSVPTVSCGLGADHWDRVSASPDYVAPFKLESGIRFIHVSSCFPRKGIDLLLEAWSQAFTSEDPVELVIKTFSNPHNGVDALVEGLSDNHANLAPITILNCELADGELKALIEQCDVMVLPSRAEGFCLPAVEAILSGLPVMTTRWGGQLDFIDCGAFRALDYRFEFAETHFDQHGSVWASASVADLKMALQDFVAADKPSLQLEVAAAAAEIRSQFSWQQVVARSSEFFTSVMRGDASDYPRIAWVSSWNTRCGIAGYSKFLIEGMSLPVSIFAEKVAASEKLTLDNPNIFRCWRANDSQETLAGLISALDGVAVDIIVVQFNFYFYDFNALSTLISSAKHKGKKVVLVLHSTMTPPDDASKSLVHLKPALNICDRLIVHSIHDLNRLKSIGVVNNVALFPHGVLAAPTPHAMPESRPSSRFILASFGFCLPHKGLVELIEAVNILRIRGYSIELRMFNALHAVPVSAEMANTLSKHIDELNLHDLVKLDTRFINDEEVLEKLACADLVVFPYQRTGESSSAAVRHGIASGVPVAVTPLAIFDDVCAAVNILPGNSATDIASGVEDLLMRWQEGKTLFPPKYDAWRDAHKQRAVSMRLEGLLTGLHRAR